MFFQANETFLPEFLPQRVGGTVGMGGPGHFPTGLDRISCPGPAQRKPVRRAPGRGGEVGGGRDLTKKSAAFLLKGRGPRSATGTCVQTFHAVYRIRSEICVKNSDCTHVWSGHSRWLFSCSLYIPCLTSPCFTSILRTRLTIKKAECQRIDAFELRCWRRLLRVSWTKRRSNKSNPKGNQH